jgi:hypothetical protein
MTRFNEEQMKRADHAAIEADVTVAPRRRKRTGNRAYSRGRAQPVEDNLERARMAGIGWPLPSEWTDEALEQRLFACIGVKPGRRH